MPHIDADVKMADAIFENLEKNKASTHEIYHCIVTIMNETLKKEDIEQLLLLIPFMESGAGTLAYKYIGETHRLLRMLRIISLEYQAKKPVLSAGCPDKSSLWDKYMLILFALRRLLFRLSEDSVNEAASFLISARPSPYAVYTMLQEDLILPDQSLYDSVVSLPLWDEEDRQLFLALIKQERHDFHE